MMMMRMIMAANVGYLMRMMTEGVWAMAPIMLQAHTTPRKVRNARWHPALWHFPGNAVPTLLPRAMHLQPIRSWETDGGKAELASVA